MAATGLALRAWDGAAFDSYIPLPMVMLAHAAPEFLVLGLRFHIRRLGTTGVDVVARRNRKVSFLRFWSFAGAFASNQAIRLATTFDGRCFSHFIRELGFRSEPPSALEVKIVSLGLLLILFFMR
jgi:hypothetical protein